MLENDLNAGANGPLDVLEPDERLTLAQVYFNAVCRDKPFKSIAIPNQATDEWHFRFSSKR